MADIIHTTEIAPTGYHHTNAGVLPNEWTSRPLSSIVEEITETAGTRRIETVSISAGIGFVNQAEKFGKELSGKQYEKYTVLHRGDFSYNKGNSNLYPQGCIYRLKDRTEAAVPNVFESFRVADGNPDYYEQLFVSGFLNKQLYSRINRGVRDDGLLNLRGKDFYSCEVPCPPLIEQGRIAEILLQYDKVIELTQEKIKELKQLKREHLRTMFPVKGKDKPENRFPGFVNPWKWNKLGKVSIRMIVGLATSVTPYYRETGVPILRNLNIKENYLDDNDLLYLDETYAQAQKSKQIHEGDVITVHTGYIGISCVVPKKYDNCLTFTTLITTPDKKVLDSFFLSQYLNSTTGLMTVREVTTQGGRQNLNTNDFVEVPIPLTSIEEQQRIAAFFQEFDNLIALHQQKLAELRTGKKALAQLLLTGLVRVHK